MNTNKYTNYQGLKRAIRSSALLGGMDLFSIIFELTLAINQTP